MTTNAFSSRMGVSLQDMVEAMNGSPRFIRFRTRLAGEVQNGVRRGDHVMEYVFLLGVDYHTALTASIAILKTRMADPAFVQVVVDDMKALGITNEITGEAITDLDVQDALTGTVRGRKGLLTAYTESLAGTNGDYSCEDVYEPLMVDGSAVKGCKVYVGKGDPTDPKAPIPGNVYLTGIVMSSKLIEASANGSKVPGRRGAVVVAKDYLSELLKLPVGRFKTPRLHKGEQYEVVCGAVAFHATEDGPVTPGRALTTQA